MYKIVQNYLQSNDYDYAHEYGSINEADKVIAEYIKDDKDEGVYHNYTIVDNDYDDAIEKEKEAFEQLAIITLKDLGIPENEAVNLIDDYNFKI